MPVTIGVKPSPSFADPMGLLSDCHRRIERFLAVLLKVAEQANGGSMTEEQSRAWQQALEYFRNAAPRHTADEEESLFPRLRSLDDAGLRNALVEMQKLEADHDQATEWHELVDQLGSKWIAQGSLTKDEHRVIKQALLKLEELYTRHIRFEDKNLFPLAEGALTAPEKADIGAEMAQRRGLNRTFVGSVLA